LDLEGNWGVKAKGSIIWEKRGGLKLLRSLLFKGRDYSLPPFNPLTFGLSYSLMSRGAIPHFFLRAKGRL